MLRRGDRRGEAAGPGRKGEKRLGRGKEPVLARPAGGTGLARPAVGP